MARSVRRIGVLAFLLLGVDFFDELASGIPFVSSPEIKSTFDVSYGQAAGWLIAAMGALSLILEPPLFMLADRVPRRVFVTSGLLVLAAVCALAAAAPTYGMLVFALLLFGPASGAGVSMSQATLMDAFPQDRERMMTRWTIAGSLGDLATPSFVAIVAALGYGWRGGFAVAGGLIAVYAVLLGLRLPGPSIDTQTGNAPIEAATEPKRESTPRAILRLFREHPRLVVWGFGVALCDFMDEILVAFGALYMRDVQGLSAPERAIALTVLMVGGLLGLLVADRLLERFTPRAVLGWAAALTVVSWLAWLASNGGALGYVSLFAVGFTAACHYPIAKAQAYRVVPERSGAVNAALVVFGPVGLVAPIAIGTVADQVGLLPALLILLIQPLGLLLITVRWWR